MLHISNSVTLAPQLADIFSPKKGESGVATIGKIVKDFKFANVDVKSEDSFLHEQLAPAFGRVLTKDYLKEIDDDLKIMIAATNRELAKRTWDKVISVCMSNPLMEPMDSPQSNIVRAHTLNKAGSNGFTIDRVCNTGVVNEVYSWFINLIADEDVINSIEFNIKVLSNVVATTGAVINDFAGFLTRKERQELTIVDIGVLRYPDLEQYFKVFRIQLTAWRESKAVTVVGKDSNGITGQYNMRKFQPRVSVIEKMNPKIQEKARYR
ncbi:hypothetical protein MVEN_01622700 [Mycena venus]|uniref:Uncharacterized protein n=1 Tax=Mycena venus TaxID=2733690 RepID=A0A8H7CQ32_9AGAR|nr:hypothetical protein MVEN_01622700 [Mycena venus]